MGGSSNPPVSLPGEGVILNWTAYKRATVVVVPFDRTVSTFSGLGLFFFGQALFSGVGLGRCPVSQSQFRGVGNVRLVSWVWWPLLPLPPSTG